MPSVAPFDPDWEPLEITVKVRVTRSFSLALDLMAAELRLSKALLVRESVRRGFQPLIDDVRFLRRHGYRPAAHLAGMTALTPRRGESGEGVVSARWSKVPADFVEEPVVPEPEVDRD